MALSRAVNQRLAATPRLTLITTGDRGWAAAQAVTTRMAAITSADEPSFVDDSALRHVTRARGATPTSRPAMIAATCVPWPKSSTPDA